MIKKNYTLEYNTLGLLLIFIIIIIIGYILYNNKESNNELNNVSVNVSNKSVDNLELDMVELNNLVNNSDKVIKELEKFNDLKKVENLDEIKGNFTLQLGEDGNNNHKLYNDYFMENPIDCIVDEVNERTKENMNKIQNNMVSYENNLNTYIAQINLDLIEFLQRSYKDAHKMNIKRQIELEDIDKLPGKFM